MIGPKEYVQEIFCKNPFTPLWQVAYSYLKREIITLRLSPGEKLVESSLASAMEISRSPVRKAIQKLTAEGLIVEMNRRLQIAPITKEDLLLLARARYGIDSAATFSAAKIIREEQLAAMENLVQQLEDAKSDISFYKFATIDDNFHALIYESSQNPYMISMYAMIRPNLLRYRYLLMAIHHNKDGFIRYVRKCHRAILSALKNHLSAVAMAEAQHDAATMLENIARMPNNIDYDIFKNIDNSSVLL